MSIDREVTREEYEEALRLRDNEITAAARAYEAFNGLSARKAGVEQNIADLQEQMLDHMVSWGLGHTDHKLILELKSEIDALHLILKYFDTIKGEIRGLSRRDSSVTGESAWIDGIIRRYEGQEKEKEERAAKLKAIEEETKAALQSGADTIEVLEAGSKQRRGGRPGNHAAA